MKIKKLLFLSSGISVGICCASGSLTTHITLSSSSTIWVEACASSSRYWLNGCTDSIHSGTSTAIDDDSDAEYFLPGVELASSDGISMPNYNIQGSCNNYPFTIDTDNYDDLIIYFQINNPYSDVTFTANATVNTSGAETLTVSGCESTEL